MRLVSLGWLMCAMALPGLAQITVGPSVQVSKAHPDRYHAEMGWIADPKNPKRILGGSMMWDPEEGTPHALAYLTDDGGKTWQLTYESHGFSADPAYAFDADGNAYFTYAQVGPDGSVANSH